MNSEKRRMQKKKWRDANPDYLRNWRKANPDSQKKTYDFKGKMMYPEENPRKNICTECGKKYPEDLTRQTCMHHMFYDEEKPLAWTVELCGPCHVGLHRKYEQEKTAPEEAEGR